MSNYVTCKEISKSFGAQLLFKDVTLNIGPNEKVGVIGPNGSGKSTLLKILSGLEDHDSGQVIRHKLSRIVYLAQEDQFDNEKTVEEVLVSALENEERDEIEKYTAVQTFISLGNFRQGSVNVGQLSGGWRKRLAICRAMVAHPDLLVMDEPTNHLDIEGILWLENLLAGPMAPSSYMVVSHDRQFLENSVEKIIELSSVYPEGTLQVDGPYSDFIEEREKVLSIQAKDEERLANKARREIEWLRRGPKARSSKAR